MIIKRIALILTAAGILIGVGFVGCNAQAGQQAAPAKADERKLMRDYPIEPVAFTQVKLTDEFLAPRIETNRKVSIPYAFGKCEENGRMDNFAIAGGLKQGEQRGDFPFDDTDPYKILEGASYALSVQPDPKLDKYLDDLIALIAAAQEDDGYLYTCRTNKCERLKNWFGNERWEKLGGSHELYNMGHLYEAAVAHYQATGKRTLLDVAIQNADFLCTVFGPGKLEKTPGHQVIEMGLAKLYRVTGNEKYLQLAKFYLDARGPGGNPYNQSHQRPVDQKEAVGHAVRAAYMYCGMADVAALTGDETYFKAAERIWENVVGRKLYLTGGIGATGAGEAFGKNYELPNETAYCETCAAIGNVMWNHRMFLGSGDAKYIDVLERTLYNGLISGVSLEGNTFFYPNPLASHGQHKRSPWFGCACCPGNMTRFIASIPGYVYAKAGDKVYVNLFVAGSGTVDIGGNAVKITQQTQYPWEGEVKLTIEPDRPAKFTIAVRAPGWWRNQPVPSDLYRYMNVAGQKGASFELNGEPAFGAAVEGGYFCITRKWKQGDSVKFDLPMGIRRVLAHENVEADRGRVAIERGPIVYCAEWPDNLAGVHNLVLTDDAKLTTEHRKDLLGGVTVVRGMAAAISDAGDGKLAKKEQEFTAIPYYAWAHRGAGAMAVWLARDEAVAEVATKAGTIRNPSFEKGERGNPASWERATYGGRGEFGYVDGGRTGDKCVMLSSESGADIGWLTSVTVKPRSQYRLTGWIKTEGVESVGDRAAKGALLNVHNIQPVQTNAVTGTKDWTKVEVTFDSGANPVVEINCLFGGWGFAKGKAWYDDIELELLSAKSAEMSVEIDAGKTGEPVSKYIYGQFIEHLGRCIYGGIWAEMIEDRKFYYGVGQSQSPWKPIDKANAVKMLTKDPYVGDHEPEVSVEPGILCGIYQEKLGLIKGKEYAGRIVLAASPEIDAVEVRLFGGDQDTAFHSCRIEGITAAHKSYDFRIYALGTTDNGRLEIIGVGRGSFRIGAVSLMPADNVKGMRADTLTLLKELNAPIYRWPGGNFVSGYDWRDGLGDPDKRPPRKNPAWTGVEHNDFGLHEYLAFCEEVGAEPLITVNSGFGDDHSAAEEVEYVVGAADTPMGKWRAANGHPEPWKAQWWCVGNEMYGGWQLGYMSLNHYTQKHNLFAKAMRKVYPDIKLIASGSVGSWSEGMLKSCADYMDAISEHFYNQEKKPVLAHAGQPAEAVLSKVNAHRDYRERFEWLKGRDIDIALDEWNYWYGPHVYGELGTRYFLKDALGIAAGLHEMIRNSDIMFMANYAQTVNVIGCIKTSKTEAAFATTGLALKLYRQEFGTIPVELAGDTFPLDVAAAWTSDRKALTIAVVNATEERQDLQMQLTGANLTGKGTLWIISHTDPMAYNEPGKEPNVVIKEEAADGISNKLSVPPLSISLYKLAVR
ncbi:MAG: glycoside hydrolase family 127 protein [Sedimentisphaerales bacterium]|nr:glycoside hydrolase family 127 protein [Sedimentisphaerales bacterium]